MHGQVFDVAADAPLVGATVTADDGIHAVTTGPEGRFAYPWAEAEPDLLLTIREPGYTYAQRWAEARLGEHTAVAPAYLEPLDPVLVPIGPEGGAFTNGRGNIQVDVPAGAVPRVVQMSATWYDAGRKLPGPLPASSHFTYAVELRLDANGADPAAADEVPAFGTPVTFRVANTRGFAAGTPLPMGVYDEDLGAWVAEGMGVVLEGGAWAEFQISHFSSPDLNLPVSSGPGDVAPTGENTDSSGEEHYEGRVAAEDPFHSRSSFRTGRLSLTHALPTYRSQGRDRGVGLAYTSTAAHPTAVLGAQTVVGPGVQNVPVGTIARFAVAGHLAEVYYASAEGAVSPKYLWDGRLPTGERVASGTWGVTVELTHQYMGEFWTADFFGTS